MKPAAFAMVLALFAFACRQEEPVSTMPIPTPTPSPSPSPTPTDDFVLEGDVIEALSTLPAGSEDGSASPTPSPSPSPTGVGSPGAAGAGEAPSGSATGPGSGSVAVRLSSYFSETGCAFRAGDTVVVRFTPGTEWEPPELLNDPGFPKNLETARITISGILLNPGANCLPIAESITQLEGAFATPSPRATSGARRARARARSAATPSPAPRAGTPGTSAVPGDSNVGFSDLSGGSDDEEDDPTPTPDETEFPTGPTGPGDGDGDGDGDDSGDDSGEPGAPGGPPFVPEDSIEVEEE